MSPDKGQPSGKMYDRLKHNLLNTLEFDTARVWRTLSEDYGEELTYNLANAGFTLDGLNMYQEEFFPDEARIDEIYDDMFDIADKYGGLGHQWTYYHDNPEAQLPLELLFALRVQLEETRMQQGYREKSRFVDSYIAHRTEEIRQQTKPTGAGTFPEL